MSESYTGTGKCSGQCPSHVLFLSFSHLRREIHVLVNLLVRPMAYSQVDLRLIPSGTLLVLIFLFKILSSFHLEHAEPYFNKFSNSGRKNTQIFSTYFFDFCFIFLL